MTHIDTRPQPISRNFQKHTNPNPIQQWLLQRFHNRVAALVKHRGVGATRIADIGCGEGFVAKFLLDNAGDFNIVGFDRAHEAVQIASVQVNRAAFGQADVGSIPLATNSVDIAVCLEVLEHIDDPQRTLRELKRISRSYVVVSTPNQPFFALANLSRLKNLKTWGDDPEHVQWWTGPAFVKLVGGVLPVVSVDYSFPWTIIVARSDDA